MDNRYVEQLALAANDDDLLGDLNPAQREAATHHDGPLLVVAGAGSGKTAVLTRRVAHLIREHGVPPFSILAITFTNKAAGQMRDRIEALVGPVARTMWIGTFHSMCARLLRREAALPGASRFKPSQVLHAISRVKDEMLGPEVMESSPNWELRAMAPVFRE